eukprot:1481776-Amphidinium_carterae.1
MAEEAHIPFEKSTLIMSFGHATIENWLQKVEAARQYGVEPQGNGLILQTPTYNGATDSV